MRKIETVSKPAERDGLSKENGFPDTMSESLATARARLEASIARLESIVQSQRDALDAPRAAPRDAPRAMPSLSGSVAAPVAADRDHAEALSRVEALSTALEQLREDHARLDAVVLEVAEGIDRVVERLQTALKGAVPPIPPGRAEARQVGTASASIRKA